MAPSKPVSNIGMHRRGESRPRREAVAEAPSSAPTPAREAEAAFFRACGIGKPSVARALEAAETNGTSVESELIAARLIKPDIYYRWLAQYLELPFLERIDPRSVLASPAIDALLRRDGPLRIVDRERVLTVISPSASTLQRERRRLAERPALRSRFVVASPATIRAAVWTVEEEARVRRTTGALEEKRREHSARTVLTGFQGFCIGLALCAMIAVSLTWPIHTLVGVHLTMTAFFLSASLLRLLAAAFGKRPAAPILPREARGLPVYTILVALKDEAAMAGQLVRALERIDWPKTRLDIKFICEKSDTATVAALRAANPGPQCEIIFVPDHGPKTKPKALAYGMAGARGDYVALYDAEDIPAPAQLREAFAIFSASDGKVGCVQAPLVVSNFRQNWLSALFAIEYAGLFRALVPFLGRRGLPIPLGGTSNHFRRSVLDEVGGWDPYNVTEDADLGMRLYRAGYRTVAAYHATIETAPDTLPVWMRQRSRWLKGWLQTWLVMMRHPLRTMREMGAAGFFSAQVFIAGMMVSTLAHPFMYLFIAVYLAGRVMGVEASDGSPHGQLFLTDVVSVTSSYIAFATMGVLHMTRQEKRHIALRHMAALPAYWLAMGCAAWMAIFELPRKAHHWAKTPHPAEKAGAAEHATDQVSESAGAGSGNRTRAISLGS
ncbi:MAG: glycosyl transferase [Rhizobiales bacterium]|nr:glycosyl transferase [Hyphomicrobiales bacterium]|tara:strand:+ start:392 stop:2392 length:2001 start_codon:yes stop_codon:yes gene_type:complete